MIPNDTRSGRPNSIMVLCPVNGCPWRYELGSSTRRMPLVRPASSPDDLIRNMVLAATEADDAELLAHVEGHPIEDFLRTIKELRDELDAIGTVDAMTALPGFNLDAATAARTWAAEHGHPQPDDRMLAAYGAALAGDPVDAARAQRAVAFDFARNLHSLDFRARLAAIGHTNDDHIVTCRPEETVADLIHRLVSLRVQDGPVRWLLAVPDDTQPDGWALAWVEMP